MSTETPGQRAARPDAWTTDRSLPHGAGQGPTGDTGRSKVWTEGRSQDLTKLGALTHQPSPVNNPPSAYLGAGNGSLWEEPRGQGEHGST